MFANTLRYTPNTTWETVIHTKPPVIILFLRVITYILYFRGKSGRANAWNHVAPSSQDDLGCECAPNEKEELDEHGLDASVSKKKFGGT